MHLLLFGVIVETCKERRLYVSDNPNDLPTDCEGSQYRGAKYVPPHATAREVLNQFHEPRSTKVLARLSFRYVDLDKPIY